MLKQVMRTKNLNLNCSISKIIMCYLAKKKCTLDTRYYGYISLVSIIHHVTVTSIKLINRQFCRTLHKLIDISNLATLKTRSETKPR